MIYSLGWWDAEDGKGYREHILTGQDFKDTGMCEYMRDLYMEYEMPGYIETVKMKETKTQKTYSLPTGKIVIKKDKSDFKIDKDTVLENIKMLEGYEDYIKVKEDLAW